MNLIKLYLWILACVALVSCAAWQKAKPLVSTVDDLARSMCSVFFGQQNGISIEDAARLYCDTREKWAPWIDPVLAGTQAGGQARLGTALGDPSEEPPENPPSLPAGEPVEGGSGNPPAQGETSPGGQPGGSTDEGD